MKETEVNKGFPKEHFAEETIYRLFFEEHIRAYKFYNFLLRVTRMSLLLLYDDLKEKGINIVTLYTFFPSMSKN